MIFSNVISNFYIQRSRFGRKSDKFGWYSKNNWTLQGSWGSLFPTPGDPWHLVKGSVKGSGGQDCRGKVEGRGLVEPWPALQAFRGQVYYCIGALNCVNYSRWFNIKLKLNQLYIKKLNLTVGFFPSYYWHSYCICAATCNLGRLQFEHNGAFAQTRVQFL